MPGFKQFVQKNNIIRYKKEFAVRTSTEVIVKKPPSMQQDDMRPHEETCICNTDICFDCHQALRIGQDVPPALAHNTFCTSQAGHPQPRMARFERHWILSSSPASA